MGTRSPVAINNPLGLAKSKGTNIQRERRNEEAIRSYTKEFSSSGNKRPLLGLFK